MISKVELLSWLEAKPAELTAWLEDGLPHDGDSFDPLAVAEWLKKQGLAETPTPTGIVGSLREVATAFGVSHGVVRSDWRSNGMPGEVGNWDLAKIAAWRESRRMAREPISPDADLLRRKRVAEVMILETKAAALDVELKEKVNSFWLKDEVLQAVSIEVCHVRDRLLQCPDHMEMRFPAETRAENKQDFADYIDRLLREMATWAEAPIEETTTDAK